jgi:5-methylcytosine-specific restriction endonuclease McrA
MSVDHLVLWEEGGPTIEVNLITACKKCNKVRGNTSYAEWLKHPRYKNVSAKLKPEVRAANEALLATLDAIPKMVSKRTR